MPKVELHVHLDGAFDELVVFAEAKAMQVCQCLYQIETSPIHFHNFATIPRLGPKFQKRGMSVMC